MRLSGLTLPVFLLLLQPGLEAQSATDEVFRVYTEAPRLLLNQKRLRLLRRENERKSMRWEQFDTLMRGGARMPEPAFAAALHAVVTGDPGSLRKAADAGMAASNAREAALVYDWCREQLSPAQAKALEAKLRQWAAQPSRNLEQARDRVFAALALAGVDAALAENSLRDFIVKTWRAGIAPGLESGKTRLAGRDLYPMFEILHVVRDNLTIDLRESAPSFFKPLAGAYLLSHYPAPFPAPENEYRIPSFKGPGEPDLAAAALSRATGLSMVAYDNNARDSQFLQGWLLMDHFLLRGSFGIPYEFLWANPYQPGLPYFRFPLEHHDPASGALFARSSWEDDATWFGLVEGQLQLFADGKITLLNRQLKQPPIEVGKTRVVVASEPLRFEAGAEEESTVFVVGLQPGGRYLIEVDDEELTDGVADRAGTLAVPLAAGSKTGIRIARGL